MISSVVRSAMLRRSRPASEGAHPPIWLHRRRRSRVSRDQPARGASHAIPFCVDIAVVVNGGMAETLQSTPLLRTLRAGLPDRPDRPRLPVDGRRPRRRHPTGRPGHPPRRAPRAGARGGLRLWSTLRSLRLDAVFLCTSGAAPATAAYFAGIPQRSGVGGGIGLLLTGRVKPRRAENQAETWLRLAEVAGVHQQLHTPRLRAGSRGPAASRAGPPRHRARPTAGSWSRSPRAPATPRATQAPAAATAWDPERWAHLANQLAQRHGAGILLVGSAHDR